MYSFIAYGHKNILATHKTTIEFTKDKDLTLKGNCVLGVNADFDLSLLKKSIKKIINKTKNKTKIIIKVNDLREEIVADVNADFNDNREIVIRKSDFISKRTLAINADKACSDLNRKLIKKIKNPKQEIKVLITNL